MNTIKISALAVLGALLLGSVAIEAQQAGRGGQGGGNPFGGGAPLPESPTAVTLPEFTRVTGPGAMFDSAGAQWPGMDMTHFGYVADEYLVSGQAAGKPYTTRVVIRRPDAAGRFSGLVVAEPMHPVGAAHAFEYNSVYLMDSGHIAVEIATAGTEQFAEFNAERYGRIEVSNDQGSEILAQVGALVRSDAGPLGAMAVRNMVLWGTSASSAILVNYLPAHAVLRQPDMSRIYDGFLPTMNGSQIRPVDVPMIHVPTQHEYENIGTWQQDGDAPGEQLRVFEFVGMGHLDSRNTRHRFDQRHCVNELSEYPSEAFMSVALHHLFNWVDEGIVPPHAERVIIDRNTANDGSLMQLDAHGNAMGGIRNPYVDVPIAKYTARNRPTPAGEAPVEGGGFPRTILCTLSAWQTRFSAAELRDLYGSPADYVTAFEQRLYELEAAGWSLPVYHELLMADARAVTF